jgi:hypothetical protein
MATTNALKILGVAGPFREPREPAFSYDYSIQRPQWPMPHAVRVKVAIAEELDVLRGKILGPVTRKIADEKLRIADQDGLLSGRADVVVAPFAGPLAHLFARLESWINEHGEAVRIEIKERVKI